MHEQAIYWHILSFGPLSLLPNHQVLQFLLSPSLNTSCRALWMVYSDIHIAICVDMVHLFVYLDCGPPRELAQMVAILAIGLFNSFFS